MRRKMNLSISLAVVLSMLILIGCTADNQQPAVMKKAITTGGTAASNAPYSPGILAGNTLYCSGRLGINPETGELGQGIAEQTKRALESIQSIVTAAGMSMSDVVSVNVFLKNLDDFSEMNEAYRTFFTSDPPARATVAVAGLVRDALVEISCIAVKTE